MEKQTQHLKVNKKKSIIIAVVVGLLIMGLVMAFQAGMGSEGDGEGTVIKPVVTTDEAAGDIVDMFLTDSFFSFVPIIVFTTAIMAVFFSVFKNFGRF